MVGGFLRGNKVLYKTYKINYLVLNQKLVMYILRYEIIFLRMKAKAPYFCQNLAKLGKERVAPIRPLNWGLGSGKKQKSRQF
jgi:hypothetical protein